MSKGEQPGAGESQVTYDLEEMVKFDNKDMTLFSADRRIQDCASTVERARRLICPSASSIASASRQASA
jgi:hypothetical protein